LDQVASQEAVVQLRQAIYTCLTEQERLVISLRYGLGGNRPHRQREVASATGISRSYVSHHAYCKR
jgi:RNA polymerase sporulation-specific sigma factor